MSLIYQSLQKLQLHEGGVPGGSGDFGSPKRRSRGLLWILSGLILLVSAALLVSWTWWFSPSQNTARDAASRAPDSVPGTNASRKAESDVSSRQNSSGKQNREKAGLSGAKSRETSSESKVSRLVSVYGSGNRTRARITLEFDRMPKHRVTRQENGSLRLGLPRTELSEQASPTGFEPAPGVDIGVLSRLDPLRLRLQADRLKEHSTFTLPGTENYGPRLVCSLHLKAPGQREEGNPSSQKEESNRHAESRGERAQSPGEHSSAEKQEPQEQESQPKRQKQTLAVSASGSKSSSSNSSINVCNLGKRLHSKKQWDKAAMELRQCLKQDPGRIEARLLLSRILEQRGKEAEAASVLRKGFRHEPGRLDLRLRYARIQISRGQNRAALRGLKMQDPPVLEEHISYYALLAAARRKLGQHDSAARIYRALADQQPNQGKWWMGLGLCLEAQGREAAAKSAYSRALEARHLQQELEAFLKRKQENLAGS